MFKVMITLLIATALATGSCVSAIRRSGVDLTIKTDKGWVRVCNNNNLRIYLPEGYSSSDFELNNVCKCLINRYKPKDRSIGANVGGDK